MICGAEEHDYEFLRQDRDNEGYERNPVWAYYDVFFCRKCLKHERVLVKQTVPARDHFGEQRIR